MVLPVEIVATIPPLGFIASELTADLPDDAVSVTAVLDGAVSPHGFEPSPSDMRSLNAADLVLCNGMGLDDWAMRAGRGGAVVVSFADVAGISGGHHHSGHSGDAASVHSHCDHSHGDDPHLWLDVEQVGRFSDELARVIAGRFESAGDPESAETVRAAAYRMRLIADDVDGRFEAALAKHEGGSVITFHDVLSRITDRYGLEVAAVLRPIETLEPAPGDLRQAVEAIDEHGITAVFIEPQFSPAAAEQIADRTGVQLVTMDPLGVEAGSWEELMDGLLAALVDGLSRDK